MYQSDICDGEANSDDDEETKKAALEEQSRPKVGGVGGAGGGEAEFFPKKGVEALWGTAKSALKTIAAQGRVI